MSKLIACLLTVFALYFSQSMAADSPADLFSKAGAAYKAQDFETAAKLYESLIQAGNKSADVYYNLGNCYFKLNLIGRSIVNYERATALSPDDEDILHNLKLAQSKTIDRVQSVPQMGFVTKWKKFLAGQSSGSWSYMAISFLWLALICAALYLFVTSKKALRISAYSFMLLSVLFLLLAFIRNHEQQNHNYAILLVESTNVKSAPDENANNIFVIHEGLKIQILDQVGIWHKIRLADGKVGWLQKDKFERI